ncbi:MAG: acyl-CoA thioesterase [bacterium]|nr:acyl-CoA thioesterase [bacterium]
MQGRRVRESVSEYSEIALPIYANPLGELLGGRVMHLVDMAGALAAARHSRRPVVTASVDVMTFLHPVHIGQLVVLKSSVNRTIRTSMEVGVKVMVEDLATGEVRHTSSAYLTFVALDNEGRPTPVPPVIPETPDEQRRFDHAGERRQYRLDLKARAQAQEAKERKTSLKGPQSPVGTGEGR